MTDFVYVAKFGDEYKLVYGYLPELVFNLYQTVAAYQNYYGN